LGVVVLALALLGVLLVWPQAGALRWEIGCFGVAALITAWLEVLEPVNVEWLFVYTGRFITDWAGLLPVLQANVDAWFGERAWRVRRAVLRAAPMHLQSAELAPAPTTTLPDLLATFTMSEHLGVSAYADAPPLLLRAQEADRLRLLESAVRALPKVVTGWPDGDDNEDRSTALTYIAPYLPPALAEEARRLVMESIQGGRWKVYGLCTLHHHTALDVIGDAVGVWQSGEPTYSTQIVGREYEILAMAPYIRGDRMDSLLDYLLDPANPAEPFDGYAVFAQRGKHEALGVLAPTMDAAQVRRVLASLSG
ncbi:MAG: hypothetical protein GYB64_20660, partial [Chloroflexi bacterium]|nr:hypothetical protein [Chloroflexota bacterium]